MESMRDPAGRKEYIVYAQAIRHALGIAMTMLFVCAMLATTFNWLVRRGARLPFAGEVRMDGEGILTTLPRNASQPVPAWSLRLNKGFPTGYVASTLEASLTVASSTPLLQAQCPLACEAECLFALALAVNVPAIHVIVGIETSPHVDNTAAAAGEERWACCASHVGALTSAEGCASVGMSMWTLDADHDVMSYSTMAGVVYWSTSQWTGVQQLQVAFVGAFLLGAFFALRAVHFPRFAALCGEWLRFGCCCVWPVRRHEGRACPSLGYWSWAGVHVACAVTTVFVARALLLTENSTSRWSPAWLATTAYFSSEVLARCAADVWKTIRRATRPIAASASAAYSYSASHTPSSSRAPGPPLAFAAPPPPPPDVFLEEGVDVVPRPQRVVVGADHLVVFGGLMASQVVILAVCFSLALVAYNESLQRCNLALHQMAHAFVPPAVHVARSVMCASRERRHRNRVGGGGMAHLGAVFLLLGAILACATAGTLLCDGARGIVATGVAATCATAFQMATAHWFMRQRLRPGEVGEVTAVPSACVLLLLALVVEPRTWATSAGRLFAMGLFDWGAFALLVVCGSGAQLSMLEVVDAHDVYGFAGVGVAKLLVTVVLAVSLGVAGTSPLPLVGLCVMLAGSILFVWAKVRTARALAAAVDAFDDEQAKGEDENDEEEEEGNHDVGMSMMTGVGVPEAAGAGLYSFVDESPEGEECESIYGGI
jgi:hypothetical protein